MEKRTRVLFSIYIRKVLPGLLVAVLLLFVLFAIYPYFYVNLSATGGEEGILDAIKIFLQHSLILELGVVYTLAYFLYYTAIGENEHIFIGSLPVGRKKQYQCMAGSIFFVIFCMMLVENILVYKLWDSKTTYSGGVHSAVCRLVLLLFLTCFFLWMFHVFSLENWWNSILILAGLLIFCFCFIRLSISFAYLFGSEHNILFYQLKNIWYCLTDLYTKERNPAQLSVCSIETQALYAQRNRMTMLFCIIFLLLAVVFFLWGRRGFCKYGHMGKLKKWNPQRAKLLMLCVILWGGVYIGALGSMEMSWYKVTSSIDSNTEELDWSDPWFIYPIQRNNNSYSDEELTETYEERVASLVDDGGEWKIETTALIGSLLGKNNKSIEGTLKISTWDPGMIYCIPRTVGAWWAKLQFFLSIAFGAGLSLLFEIWQKRKILSANAE